MRPGQRIFVVGGAHTPFLGKGHPDFVWKRHPDFGIRNNPSLQQMMGSAARGALETTRIDASQVDKAWVSNFLGECFARQGHLGSMLVAEVPGLAGKPIARVEAACASGGAAILACIDALHGPGCDITLAVGAEIETNVPGREGVEHMALAAHVAEQRHLEFAVFPWFFARRAKAWKEAFGGTDTDIARVVVKAYANAARNPLALKQAVAMDLESARMPSEKNRTFLEDATLHDHIKLHDCTDFTDGASAVVLATEAGLTKLGIDRGTCTEIVATGHTVQALGAETDPTQMTNVRAAAEIAYADAGITPSDVGLAEVHDCFAITEIQLMEALGFCDLGGAGQLLADGSTDIDGPIPVNPGGGLLGFGHPIGATGVKQVVEIWRQMQGRCGDYQLSARPEIAVSANLGGDDRTAVVMVHRATI